ncbi:MAG: DUF4360 domain-containing protein [Chroococcidiopsis sp.]
MTFKKIKKIGVLLSVSTVIGMNVVTTKTLAQEEPSIQFGDAIGGPGCVIADQLVGEDGRTLSLLFDDFQAKNGKRKPCNIRVNTTIPSGFHVQNVQVLYQGSTEVPSGSRGTSLSRSYTFTGGALGIAKAEPVVSKFTSTQELYQEEDEITVASASCGGKGQLGVNMIAQSSKGSSIIVDTADFNAGKVELSFEIAACNN